MTSPQYRHWASPGRIITRGAAFLWLGQDVFQEPSRDREYGKPAGIPPDPPASPPFDPAVHPPITVINLSCEYLVSWVLCVCLVNLRMWGWTSTHTPPCLNILIVIEMILTLTTITINTSIKHLQGAYNYVSGTASAPHNNPIM